MKDAIIICCTLILMLSASAALQAQDESPLARQIRRTLADKEPVWRYVAAIQSGRIPLVPSEKRVLVGQWERKLRGGSRESIGVRIYGVENASEAVKWLSPLRRGPVASGWKVGRYDMGDEGYIAEYPNGKQFEIQFRKVDVVVKVDGRILREVERFAKYVVAEIPAD